MHTSIVSFLDYLKRQRQASPHTLRSYQDDLEVFSHFLEEIQVAGADPTVVDSAGLRRYAAWLNSQGYAATTIARRLASLRSFFRYLRRQ
ncbi:MAG: site-specific integrase, partial [Isosphaeraceae bacterium]